MKNFATSTWLPALAGLTLALTACGTLPNTQTPPKLSVVNGTDDLQSVKLGTQAPLLVSQNAQAIEGQYIVVLKDGAAPQLSAQNLAGQGMSAQSLSAQHLVAQTFGLNAQGLTLLQVYGTAVQGFAARLSAQNLSHLRLDPRVKYIEQDAISASSATQSGATWGLDRIDQRNRPLNGSYVYNTTASNVTAYIIDSGIYTGHSQFGGRAFWGGNWTGDGNNYDCNGHGTHVAGTVGSATYGVAKGIRLIAVKVLGCDGYGANSGIIGGINWAASNRNGPAVANISITGGYSQAVNDSVNSAVNSGLIIAIAAGNNGDNACNYSPASADNGINVGNVTSSDTRNSSSNYGACLDLFAPGTNITSTSASGGTTVMSGTSMATPHVAGVIALYLSANPNAGFSSVKSALLGSATTNILGSIGSGSPNRMLYSQLGGGTTPTPQPGSATYSAYLQQGQTATAPALAGFSYTGGTLTGTLSGPSGTDFDLYLQKLSSGSWVTVASSEGSASSEKITYGASSGTYRWRIYAYTGSGNMTLAETRQ
ncbi:S8 family peptidase [Deinococcus cavernae]|uniref:S8 family peptidase n=1 Tax=Deinococcus cavernae TaxID=2320857 RepID=A0A418V9Q3_9DEIO|nr:S8 family peptidase [Deinococcus cavernae]RJF72845.1 S8 family peptidase [Deinococcus cavernae]